MSLYDAPFLLMGDFNSRTGQLDDVLDDIDLDLLHINDMYVDDVGPYNLPSNTINKRVNKDYSYYWRKKLQSA